MTNESEPQPETERVAKRLPSADDPDGLTDADVRPKDVALDLLLSTYIGFDDTWEGGIGITLQSNGAIISGTVISRVEWNRRAVELLREGGAGDAADRIGELFDKIHNNSIEEWRRRDELDLLGRARCFIHMRDVRFLNGSSMNLPIWRGCLADVTGWSLGVWTDNS